MPRPRVWLVLGILHNAEEQWALRLSGSRPHRDCTLTEKEYSFRVWVSLLSTRWPHSMKVGSALPFLLSQHSSENETSEPWSGATGFEWSHASSRPRMLILPAVLGSASVSHVRISAPLSSWADRSRKLCVFVAEAALTQAASFHRRPDSALIRLRVL